jgi:hypothetical protein
MYGSRCSLFANRTAAAMWLELSAKAGKRPVSKTSRANARDDSSSGSMLVIVECTALLGQRCRLVVMRTCSRAGMHDLLNFSCSVAAYSSELRPKPINFMPNPISRKLRLMLLQSHLEKAHT